MNDVVSIFQHWLHLQHGMIAWVSGPQATTHHMVNAKPHIAHHTADSGRSVLVWAPYTADIVSVLRSVIHHVEAWTCQGGAIVGAPQ